MSSYQYYGIKDRVEQVTLYYLEGAELYHIIPLCDTKLSARRYIATYRCANRDFSIITKHPNPQPLYTGYVHGVSKYHTHSLYDAPLTPSPEISSDIFEDPDDFGSDGFAQSCSLD